MSGLGGKVAIIGTGTIKFGENFHQSLTATPSAPPASA